jgi:hypothetical protein
MELGEYSQSREAYSRAAELDPYNAIAKKNLNRLTHLGEHKAGSEVASRTAEPHHFIEEVGKAGVVILYNMASPAVLARMAAGDRAFLKIEGASLVAENGWGERLGEVEPKHALRLIKLMQGGNRYAAAIVSASENSVNIIIREVYQDPGQAGQLSFPPKGVEPTRTYGGDRILKRELEHEEAASEEPGFTIIDEEGMEVPLKEPLESDDDKIDDEE